MISAPVQSSRLGQAELKVSRVAGQSALTSCWAVNPLKILAPRPRGPSVWAYLSSFGGGLVAGDQTSLKVDIGDSAVCFLSTQASTKVFRNPESRPCRHTMQAEVGPKALLIMAPDPVQCFAEAMYEQKQTFHLAAGAGLVLIDWFCSGRASRGERWAFTKYQSRNEVFQEGKRVLLDSLLLTTEDGSEDLLHQMARFHCLATVVIFGEPFKENAQRLLAEINEEPVPKRGNFLFSASAVADGLVLRLAGTSTEEVGREIARRLNFLQPVLHDDPWARKW